METRLINWRTAMMKPVFPGSMLVIGTKVPVMKDGEIVDGIGTFLYIVTRVTEDGWVYGIKTIENSDKKAIIKSVLRRILYYKYKADIGSWMDNEMDGSGDCGDIIYKGWSKWFHRKVDLIMKQCGVTFEDFEIVKEWANIEIEKCPTINIYWSKTGKDTVPRDLLNTFYGNFYLVSDSSEVPF